MADPKQKSTPPSDFQEKVLTIEQQGKDITDHDSRIDALEQKLDTPEHIASLLDFASSDSKKIDKLFATIFTSMLKDEKANPEVRSMIVEIINKTDRNVFFTTTKKWGKVLGLGLIYILGWISPLIMEWLKKKFGL